MSDPDVQKENSTEGRNEGKSAASDPESNPVISCTVGQSCSALSIYGHGICMEGNPGLMDQDLLKFLCMVTSGKRSGPIVGFVWFSKGKLIKSNLSALISSFSSLICVVKVSVKTWCTVFLIKSFSKHDIMPDDWI